MYEVSCGVIYNARHEHTRGCRLFYCLKGHKSWSDAMDHKLMIWQSQRVQILENNPRKCTLYIYVHIMYIQSLKIKNNTDAKKLKDCVEKLQNYL